MSATIDVTRRGTRTCAGGCGCVTCAPRPASAHQRLRELEYEYELEAERELEAELESEFQVGRESEVIGATRAVLFRTRELLRSVTSAISCWTNAIRFAVARSSPLTSCSLPPIVYSM